MLKIGFCQWRFIGRQCMPACSAAAKQNDGDKRRENGPGKVTTVSVGQGEPPGHLLTVIHRQRKRFFTFIVAASLCRGVHCRQATLRCGYSSNFFKDSILSARSNPRK
jgi:hypothetical protein